MYMLKGTVSEMHVWWENTEAKALSVLLQSKEGCIIKAITPQGCL